MCVCVCVCVCMCACISLPSDMRDRGNPSHAAQHAYDVTYTHMMLTITITAWTGLQ